MIGSSNSTSHNSRATNLPSTPLATTIIKDRRLNALFPGRNIMAVSKAEPGKTRIGWVGTGVMGRWMCQHLMSKGYSATVYTRSREKAKALLDAGAAWADTPKAVAERSDVIFAIVGFPS